MQNDPKETIFTVDLMCSERLPEGVPEPVLVDVIAAPTTTNNSLTIADDYEPSWKDVDIARWQANWRKCKDIPLRVPPGVPYGTQVFTLGDN